MEYNMLGSSDLKISRIGFGCMSLDPGNPESESILNMALEAGINYFDTADLYQQGLNESMLGRAFQGKRNRIILASKAGNQWRPDGSGWDWNPSPAYILSCLEQSLLRLKTDYLDLYQLHGGTLEDPIDDIIEVFEKLKASGKIRHYGISSIRPNVIREYVRRSSIASVMIQYSLLDRRPEYEVLPLLSKKEIGVLVRGSLAKGLLVSKKAGSFLNYSAEDVRRVANAIETITPANGSPLNTCIQWIFRNQAVSSAVIGIRTNEQLKTLLRFDASIKVDETHFKYLDNILQHNHYTDHL